MRSKKILFLAGLLLGFACAFALLRLLAPAPATTPPGVPAGEGIPDSFLDAVRGGDFAAVREAGEKLFAPGRIFADARERLAPFEVNSHPPYTVYALHTGGDDATARRILLTLDEKGGVVSFLAEEMRVLDNPPGT